MVVRRVTTFLGFIAGALILCACGRGVLSDSPADVVAQYVAACEAGEMTKARALLTTEFDQMLVGLGSSSCGTTIESLSSRLVSESVEGDRADVVWEWEVTGGTKRARYALLLTDNGWRIAGGEEVSATSPTSDTNPAWVTTEVIPIETRVEEDPLLLEGVAYIAQPGMEGQREVTVGGGAGGETGTERVLLVAEPRVIWRGTRPRAEVLTEAQQQVQTYFDAFRAGAYNQLPPLYDAATLGERDLAAVASAVRLVVSEVVVDETRSLAVTAASLLESGGRIPPAQDRALPGEPYVKPIALVAEVPIFVRYTLFGIEQTREQTLTLRWLPGQGWQLPFWGPLAAASPAELLAVGGTTVRLEGIAAWPDATFLALRLESGDGSWVFANVADDTGLGSLNLLSKVNFDQAGRALLDLTPLHFQARHVTVRLKVGVMEDSPRDDSVIPLVR